MFFDELNDESLLQHLKASSEPAFKTLYRRYWRKCFAMAFRKIGVKSIAEEITQTVFVSLWEKRNDLIIVSRKDLLDSSKAIARFSNYVIIPPKLLVKPQPEF